MLRLPVQQHTIARAMTRPRVRMDRAEPHHARWCIAGLDCRGVAASAFLDAQLGRSMRTSFEQGGRVKFGMCSGK